MKESNGPMPRRMTAPEFVNCKQAGKKIVMVTAYDAPSAVLAERAGVDCILVGDSVGTTMLGMPNTIPVTLEDMLHHCRAVSRVVSRALLVADLPFGAYQEEPRQAFRSAARLMKEAGAHAVKVEGGANMAETIRLLTDNGVPVMGHLGLTPQSVHLFGGHKAQGKDEASAARIASDALLLEQAGAFGIVLETIPADLSRKITEAISIPTIGIGAGSHCDGQVQVWHDLLGLMPGKPFRHAKRYLEGAALIEGAIKSYVDDVRNKRFPGKEHSIT